MVDLSIAKLVYQRVFHQQEWYWWQLRVYSARYLLDRLNCLCSNRWFGYFPSSACVMYFYIYIQICTSINLYNITYVCMYLYIYLTMNYTLRFIHKHTDTYTYNYTCPIYNSTVSPATPPPVGAGGCPAAAGPSSLPRNTATAWPPAGCSRWAKIWRILIGICSGIEWDLVGF